MTPGDLIEFDLRDDAGDSGDLRLADMPRLVTRRSHPTLSHDLKTASERVRRERAASVYHTAKVVAFPQARQALCG